MDHGCADAAAALENGLERSPSPAACYEEKSADSVSYQLQRMNVSGSSGFAPSWICAICLEKIQMADTAQIKGCEHAYCANCILRWASYKENPWCPQCKLPFQSLFVCKGIDGRTSDYMQEESVCLLLRAPWFKEVPFVQDVAEEAMDDICPYEDDYDEEDDYYASNVRIGNRRWGDNGYVRAGRKEARPISSVRQAQAARASRQDGASGSGSGSGSTVVKAAGRRAKRAQKRELAGNNARN